MRLRKFLGELENKSPLDMSLVSHYFFVLGSSIVCFGFSILLVSSALFFLDFPISNLNLVLAFPIYLVITYLLSATFFEGFLKYVVIFSVVAFSIILFLTAIDFEGRFYDISYDGQAYHQEAIIQLDNGWNPFFTQIDEVKANGLDVWLNHYPKGLWIMESVIYKWTGNIESSKALHIFFIFASFSLTLSSMLDIKRFHSGIALIIAAITAFNPISIYQSLSFYQDGILLSVLICFFNIAFKIFHGSRGIKIIPFIAVISIFVNIKLTALPYMVIFLAAYLGLMWVEEKVHLTIQMLKVSVVAMLMAVCVIGFSPYMTNIVYKGHILYPAMGREAKNYIEGNIPENLYDDSPPARLFVSIFSRSDNSRGENSAAVLKWPFTYDEKELAAFRDTNAKEGGFGPLFSGAFLLSLAILAYFYIFVFVLNRKNVMFKYTVYKCAFIIFVILLSAMINPAASLARFVPQVWLLCILTLILSFSVRSYLTNFLGVFLVGTLALNSFLIGREYVTYNRDMTSQIKGTLERLSQAGEVKIDLKEFSSNQIRLNKHNIKWTRVNSTENCNSRERFMIHSVAEICSN